MDMVNDRCLNPSINEQRRGKAVALNRESKKVLEMTHYWTPPVPDWVPMKTRPNSTLRMACVLEDRLYQGLRFEGEVLLLTPDNWRQMITYGKPDLLLMESIWTTATGHWHMGQCPSASEQNGLLNIIEFAKRLSIPTVFWITKGHEYHEHYNEFSHNFDYVFCADPMEIDLLSAEGVHADLLLPCVQPAMFNPFRLYEYYKDCSIGPLFDGWADLERFGDELNVLHDIKRCGLSIIESRYQFFRNRLNILPKFKKWNLGCVTEKSRIIALKYAKAYITMEKTLSTRTSQQWMSLEATASRLPVVHHGELPESDLRKKNIIECQQEMDFLVEFVRFKKDDIYRERQGHLGWRNTVQQHTFSQRIHKMCKKIGINHDWDKFPKASIVMPTYRRELLHKCLDTYESQSYPNKELIVVFNGNEVPVSQELTIVEKRDDIKLVNVPSELFAGACLNYGNLLATGSYCFRMDDDDYYGPNYILDMMLQATSIDAELFGKPPSSIIFENEHNVYAREVGYPLSVVSNTHLANGNLWIGGNSISASRKFFQDIHYNDASFGAADSSLMYNLNNGNSKICAFMDRLNIVATRRQDQSTHTWKQDEKKLKQGHILTNNYKDMMV